MSVIMRKPMIWIVIAVVALAITVSCTILLNATIMAGSSASDMPPVITLEVGIEYDGVRYWNEAREIVVKPGTPLKPVFRLVGADVADLSDIAFTLDGVPIDANHAIIIDSEPHQSHMLRARGSSERHEASCGGGCGFYVKDTGDPDQPAVMYVEP